MDYQDFLLDAVDQVLSWDIPDQALAEAVISQAGLMAGINPEEITGHYPD
ncbi:hypothetical protein SAMN05216302_10549 [Nitrosomonas aestuarii]|uniref:Uncharacterized protein n=1 Tax=Nitrosomonas aestuarii TaxID=52441 RepID=A0A1I4GIG2_9PROT|nr:hypothetical protein [Nitrosomonas aestuarii]SFL28981.1 hypothetical protein SAMN05216302_10549 [Nitrosomonas aestuarii]